MNKLHQKIIISRILLEIKGKINSHLENIIENVEKCAGHNAIINACIESQDYIQSLCDAGLMHLLNNGDLDLESIASMNEKDLMQSLIEPFAEIPSFVDAETQTSMPAVTCEHKAVSTDEIVSLPSTEENKEANDELSNFGAQMHPAVSDADSVHSEDHFRVNCLLEPSTLNGLQDDYISPEAMEFRRLSVLHFRRCNHFKKLKKKSSKNKLTNDSQIYYKKAKEHELLSKLMKKIARQLIIQQRNEDQLPNILDLHGLHVQEAVNLLKKFCGFWKIMALRHNCYIPEIIIITGRGLHSSHGPKLRPAVINFLQTERYQYVDQTENQGRVFVNLSSNLSFTDFCNRSIH